MTRRITIIISLLFLTSLLSFAQSKKTRLIILADMGNEPDEEQQIAHLMMYANELDIEGLIAVTGKFLHPKQKEPYRRVLHPELFEGIIDGYSMVVENLKKHAEGWPGPDYLYSVVAPGQTEYGMEGTGPGKSSPGSELIIRQVEKDDDRPIYIVVNAGSNTLAQAIIDYQETHTRAELDDFLSKIRVFENGAQDDAGAWICANFPEVHWTRSNYQTYCYGGPDFDQSRQGEQIHNLLGPYTWEPYEYSGMGQHQWALKHIKGDHGPLGKRWPIRQTKSGQIVYLEGGGTIPWMGLIHRGLSDIEHPHWGGWSGRFTREKQANVWSKHASVRENEVNYGDFKLFTEASDTWVNPENDSVYSDIYTPVWRWRRAMYNDFMCRMDWCVSAYDQANHNPIAAINGDETEKIHHVSVKAGKVISYDASGSHDPDGDDIVFNWWIYQEAGTYQGEVGILNTESASVKLQIPEDAKGSQIHLILEIKDDNKIASMYDYRRIIISPE